jgi:hypothetical protein
MQTESQYNLKWNINILYECDKDRCIECNKKNCIPEYCTHTLNKKYAKNYYNKES